MRNLNIINYFIIALLYYQFFIPKKSTKNKLNNIVNETVIIKLKYITDISSLTVKSFVHNF